MSKYQVGDIVTVSVTGIEKYGIFVGLDEYYSGLIHISEISDGFVRNINDYVNLGETIKAKILEIDEEELHIKLSIKNMNYRITKRKRTKIEETELGFSTLGDRLDGWISEKLAEIEENL